MWLIPVKNAQSMHSTKNGQIMDDYLIRPIENDELDPQTVNFNMESLKSWDLSLKAHPNLENSFYYCNARVFFFFFRKNNARNIKATFYFLYCNKVALFSSGLVIAPLTHGKEPTQVERYSAHTGIKPTQVEKSGMHIYG